MTHHYRKCIFPFTAMVGLEKAKLALLAVSINPAIGGVLLRGDKGTGKTTLVRALANVLPEIEVVKGCPFNCNPHNPLEMCDECYRRWRENGGRLPSVKRRMKVVDLPLSVTPDRLIGTIDIEKALREGVKALKPGILAEANRNILYIDEVNLLDDYIADLILDAAAYGWNVIEREHISFRHPARFILVGSMNPEEGELRPQLLDRFGLVVNVEAPQDPEARAEIVRRVEEFNLDPESFYKKYESEEKKLTEKIARARELVSRVTIDEDLLKTLAKTLVEMRIRTCRAEIVTVRTAKAIAALDGRTRVSMEDLKKAMELALPHRLSLKPFEQPRQSFDLNKNSSGGSESHKHEGGGSGVLLGGLKSQSLDSRSGAGLGESIIEPPARDKPEFTLGSRVGERENPKGGLGSSRYSYATRVNSGVGVPVAYIYPHPNPRDVDLTGTIVNMTCHGVRLLDSMQKGLYRDLLAVRVRRQRIPTLAIIVLDASGSMNFMKRISIAKAVAQRIVEESYTKRLWLSLVVFRGDSARVVEPATRMYRRIFRVLEEIPSGGRTPLPHALQKILELSRVFKMKYKGSVVKAYLITDGKANVALGRSIRSDIIQLSRELAREGVELEIYDVRTPDLDPGVSYINLIVKEAGARVYRV